MKRVGYTSDPDLDAIFAALADPTRRAILARLTEGEASVGELAAPFAISQPAVSRHLRVLERAGLVERDIAGQRRPARLSAAPMRAAHDWLEHYRNFWPDNFDRLDSVLATLQVDAVLAHIQDPKGDHDD